MRLGELGRFLYEQFKHLPGLIRPALVQRNQG